MPQWASPADPRNGQVPLGQLPAVVELEEGVIRLVAPNPSVMTLDGTNTYVIYGRDGGAYLVDPGPSAPEHLRAVEAVIGAQKLTPKGLILTHHHIDHSEAAHAWSSLFDIPIYAGVLDDPDRAGALLEDGDRIEVDGQTITAVSTPGHTSDHICLMVSSGRLLTGDHVLGRGTSVVAYPDGDLRHYVASLLKISRLGFRGVYPGHGPELDEATAPAVVEYYLGHRLFRLGQVIGILEEKALPVGDVVQQIYAGSVPQQALFAAELSTRAALDFLVRTGYVTADPAGSLYSLSGKDTSLLPGELNAL